MINDDLKFIFIHIPKTGGTSIERVFSPQAHLSDVPMKHHTIKDLLPRNDEYSQYFRYSVVRNPWDIVCSLYTYMWKSDYDWPQKWRASLSDDKAWILKLGFLDWVKHPSFRSSSLRSARLFKPNPELEDVLQCDWLTNSEGNLEMDFIIRFESLQRDFDLVCEKIGIAKVQLGHSLKSRKRNYHDFYDTEAIEIVAKKYQKDIETFNYSF